VQRERERGEEREENEIKFLLFWKWNMFRIILFFLISEIIYIQRDKRNQEKFHLKNNRLVSRLLLIEISNRFYLCKIHLSTFLSWNFFEIECFNIIINPTMYRFHWLILITRRTLITKKIRSYRLRLTDFYHLPTFILLLFMQICTSVVDIDNNSAIFSTTSSFRHSAYNERELTK